MASTIFRHPAGLGFFTAGLMLVRTYRLLTFFLTFFRSIFLLIFMQHIFIGILIVLWGRFFRLGLETLFSIRFETNVGDAFFNSVPPRYFRLHQNGTS
jgi:hypothetical protein